MQQLVGLEVKGVHVELLVFEEVAPHRHGFYVDSVVLQLELAVAEEVSVEVGLGHLREVLEVAVVELKISGVLVDELAHAVQELKEDWRLFLPGRVVDALPHSNGELVPKPDPVLVDQILKANDGAIVGIEQYLSQRAELGSAVPAIAAVHQHVLALQQTAHHVVGALNYQKHVIVPLRLREVDVEPGVLSECGLEGLVVGLADGVDVGNVEELHLAVGVKLLGLIALACHLVAKGGHLVAGVEDHAVRAVFRLV